ncbi:MAG TPA: hypothetical protein VHC49_08310 [Mycobacteriales bacterium]|nr:hypothetical protein [Mycobacteriales bacterium]
MRFTLNPRRLVAIGMVVAAGVALYLGTGPDHSTAWAARCFQAWNEHQPVATKPDARPDGLDATAVAAFADHHKLGLAVVARAGRCVGGWGYTASQAHLPAYLYVAFDRGGHVAAAWLTPGRGGVVSRRSVKDRAGG